MAKKRKTKQEKIIADLRRKLQTQASPSATELPVTTQPTPKTISPPSTYTLPTESVALKPAAAAAGSALVRNGASFAYSYVISDLRKTALLTIIALAAQIVLHFILAR